MRKSRLMACVLASAMAAATVGTATSAMADEIPELYTYELASREVETFNVLHSQLATDFEVLSNLYDGLVSVDTKGEVCPAIATSWETDDNGVTWTFHLRDDVTWVDVNGNEKAKFTSADFVTGLEWVLNYYKNDASNTSMPMEMIVGAEDYYNYTKELSQEEATTMDNSKFLEMVGIETPDDYTVVYKCVSPKPYFPTVATYACLFPAPQAQIDELGVDGFKAVTPETIWYTGPYTLTSYVQGNEKIFTPNPAYYNKDAKTFDSVVVKMVDSLDVAYQLYQTGEIDHVDLSESNLMTIYNDPSNEYYSQLVEKRPTAYSYQFHFNYDKKLDDGSDDTNWNTAIANTAFRQAWRYGLNLESYYKRTNAINPLKCENNFYTMKGLVYKSDGTEYTTLVKEKLGLEDYNGESMVRLDADKFAELKDQAIEELTAKGVTFPIEADYYVAANNTTALDSANVLKQAFTDSFGDDFIVLNIKTYVSSYSKEVRDPHLQSFAINGWGADYGDPQNYLGQEVLGNDNAYYAAVYSNINNATDEDLLAIYKEYSDLVDKANAINDDLDARYEAYAEAEAYMIENVLVLPCNYDISWELTKVNDYTKKNGLFGIDKFKYINWETSADAYTTEDYEKFAADFDAQ